MSICIFCASFLLRTDNQCAHRDRNLSVDSLITAHMDVLAEMRTQLLVAKDGDDPRKCFKIYFYKKINITVEFVSVN